MSDSKDGIEVRRPLLRMRLERALSRGLRKRIAVPTRPVPAQQTPSDTAEDARAAAHLLSSYLAWSSAAPA